MQIYWLSIFASEDDIYDNDRISCICSVCDTAAFERQTFIVKISCIFSQRQFQYEKCIGSLIPSLFYLIAILQNLIRVKIQIFESFNSFHAIDLFPANIYLFKVNNRNTRKTCEIYSKLTIKTSKRRQWRHFGVFIVNFEHISHLFLLFLLLTLNK